MTIKIVFDRTTELMYSIPQYKEYLRKDVKYDFKSGSLDTEFADFCRVSNVDYNSESKEEQEKIKECFFNHQVEALLNDNTVCVVDEVIGEV